MKTIKPRLYGRLGKANGYRWAEVEFQALTPGGPLIPTYPAGISSFVLRYTENGKRITRGVGLDEGVKFLRQQQALPGDAPVIGAPTGTLLSKSSSNVPSALTPESGLTLEQALTVYLSELQSKSKATIVSYSAALKEFVNHAGRTKPILQVARPQLLAYKSWLYEQEMSETTRHGRLLRVVMFLKHFGIQKPLVKTDWPRPNKKTADAYSKDEVAAMLKAAETEAERLLVEFFLYSGARDGEVMHTEKNDVRIAMNGGGQEVAILSIQAKDKYGWVTKSRRDRKVRLPLDFAKRLLAAYEDRPGDALLFPNKSGRPNNRLLEVIKRIAQRAGVKNASLHKFRRTFATFRSDHSNVQTIKEALGHADIATTVRYLAANGAESDAEGAATEAAFGDLAAK